jgi:phenylacetate-CoA ligase
LPFPPKIVFTGAETLLPHQRSTIEEGFSTKVSDQYGATEQCGNISECEKHRYHVDMEFGAVEFLPIKGMPSNVRRILCTGFHNLAMPLIRYDIGDIATLSEETCSCGRQSPVIDKIDGRIESYIITPDGRRLGRLDFLFKKSPNILEAQLIQDTIDCVRFCIVRTSEYTNADEQQLITTIHEYMGHSFTIKIEYLDEIPRGKNGKFRQIISTVFKDTINKE